MPEHLGCESPISPVLTSRFALSTPGMQCLVAANYVLATFMVSVRQSLGSTGG